MVRKSEKSVFEKCFFYNMLSLSEGAGQALGDVAIVLIFKHLEGKDFQ